ncbi:hypothetical protein [Streptomyces sp. CBMA152]|nr:hypothetical protein [Streptomyces sp. CBMA152]
MRRTGGRSGPAPPMPGAFGLDLAVLSALTGLYAPTPPVSGLGAS